MRPAILEVNKTLTWVIRLYNSSQLLVDADVSPSVAIRKNGIATGDAITLTKRSATTGIYDCSYNPTAEVSGDTFTVEETAIIGGVTYHNGWEFTVVNRSESNSAQLDDIEQKIDNADSKQDQILEKLSKPTVPTATKRKKATYALTLGDDYASTSPRGRVSFSVSNTLADLTGATSVEMDVTVGSTTIHTFANGVVVNPGAADQKVDFEVLGSVTSSWDALRTHEYDAHLTTAAGNAFEVECGSFIFDCS